MKIYDESNQKDIVESITESLEKEVGSKIFTLRLLDDNGPGEGLEAMVVFEDRSVFHALITVQEVDGAIGCRVRGNFI